MGRRGLPLLFLAFGLAIAPRLAEAISPLRPQDVEAAAKAGAPISYPSFPSLLAPSKTQVLPSKGSVKALLLLIDFNDNQSVRAPSFFQSLAFDSAGKSIKTYYAENSYWQLAVGGTVTAWQRSNLSYLNYYVNRDRIPGTGDDYGFDVSHAAYAPGVDPYPKNVWGIVMEAVALADPYIDFSQFDN